MTIDLNQLFFAILCALPALLLGIASTLLVFLIKKCAKLEWKIEGIRFVCEQSDQDISRLRSMLLDQERDIAELYGEISDICYQNESRYSFSAEIDRNLPKTLLSEIEEKKQSPRRGRPPKA